MKELAELVTTIAALVAAVGDSHVPFCAVLVKNGDWGLDYTNKNLATDC